MVLQHQHAQLAMLHQTIIYCKLIALYSPKLHIAYLPSIMDRAAKRSKLNAFRFSLPQMSHRALHAICKASRAGELPEITQRSEIKAAVDEAALQSTPYGPVVVSIDLQTVDAVPISVEVSHMLALLHAAAKSKFFAKIVWETHCISPCSFHKPWSLVIYSDEAKVGNKLKYENRRSLENVYFSFLEFGADKLAKEEFWLPACTLRSLSLDKVCGRMSQLVGEILKLAFDNNGHHLRNAGVCLELPGGQTLTVFARLACVLADESALHAIWLCKGSSGLKCCIECMNVVNRDWQHASFIEDADIYKAYNKVHSLDDCVPHTTETIQAVMDALAAAKLVLGQEAFNEKQTMLGFTSNPFGILEQPSLKSVVDPCSQNCYDWAHNILQGVFQKTLWNTLDALNWPTRMKGLLQTLRDYMAVWHWPWRLGGAKPGYGDIFTDKRIEGDKAAKTIKCYSSEAISIHLVISHWLRQVIIGGGEDTPPAARAASIVFINISNLIQLLWDGPRVGITSGMVKDATTKFMDSYVAAFGDDALIWKFHGILHHSTYVERYGWSPNTMCLERKNKSVLQVATTRANDKSMAGVLREVVAKSLTVLEQGEWLNMDVGLIHPKAPNKKLLQWLNNTFGGTEHLVSAEARFCRWECCHKGDMVAFKNSGGGSSFLVGRIIFHAMSYGICYAALMPYQRLDADFSEHPTWSSWAETQEPMIVELEDIMWVLMWSQQGNTLTALHPVSFYGK